MSHQSRPVDEPALAPAPSGSVFAVRVAVLIPAFNEAAAIGEVVRDFRAALPDARVYVYDNNSTDGTAGVARTAGATLRSERLQGKGHVVRRMFADVQADVYVMADGDGTYDAAAAPEMVRRLVAGQLDMVVGIRVPDDAGAYRRGHRFGNALLTGIVAAIFGNRLSDMLSGYRVFSRRFVKSFPALAAGFETETELTIHALELNMPTEEVETAYTARPAGSQSKLRTYRDGLKILRAIVLLVKEERPLHLFFGAGIVLFGIGLLLGIPVVLEFSRTGLVPRLPTAVLATGLVLVACLSMACGMILDSVTRGRHEMKRLAYLAIPAVAPCARPDVAAAACARPEPPA